MYLSKNKISVYALCICLLSQAQQSSFVGEDSLEIEESLNITPALYLENLDETSIRDYQEALAQINKEKYRKAAKLLSQINSQYPNIYEVQYNLAKCQYRLENTDESIYILQTIRTFKPLKKQDLILLSNCYLKQGSIDKSMSALMQIPNCIEKYMHIAENYKALYNWDMSLHNFCKAYKLYQSSEIKSRNDAEKEIVALYGKYKEEDNLNTFYKILKEYSIKFK